MTGDLSVALVSTYPPTRCGIGRFAQSLVSAWGETAHDTFVRVARVAGADDPAHPLPGVAIQFDPASSIAVRAAAGHINRSDVALIQHEYGLYGPDDGTAILDLVDQIRVPVTTVVHTVLPSPTATQRRIASRLADAGPIVASTETARSWLRNRYGIGESRIHVIPHGSSWRPMSPMWATAPRRHLVTWGLLGPGKGIERLLRAMAMIHLDPAVTLDIVGQTHPKVLARSGQSYRNHLQRLCSELGLASRIRFVDRYLEEGELQRLVSRADVVVIPYDSKVQVSSGVLTDAIAAGRPVVATDFPHARELLADGAGLVVPHSDEALAAAICRLLEDDDAYVSATRRALHASDRLSWESVAEQYIYLLRSAHRGDAVA
ncbi:MAG TPA: glycosyltransferase [Acidimicrobiia bacterium]|nr:glycosyltransferase [Acidimicrobiia bacterium]